MHRVWSVCEGWRRLGRVYASVDPFLFTLDRLHGTLFASSWEGKWKEREVVAGDFVYRNAVVTGGQDVGTICNKRNKTPKSHRTLW